MAERDAYNPEDVRTILRVSMAANKGIYQKLKEEGPMEDVFKELFRKELTAERDADRRLHRPEHLI